MAESQWIPAGEGGEEPVLGQVPSQTHSLSPVPVVPTSGMVEWPCWWSRAGGDSCGVVAENTQECSRATRETPSLVMSPEPAEWATCTQPSPRRVVWSRGNSLLVWNEGLQTRLPVQLGTQVCGCLILCAFPVFPMLHDWK